MELQCLSILSLCCSEYLAADSNEKFWKFVDSSQDISFSQDSGKSGNFSELNVHWNVTTFCLSPLLRSWKAKILYNSTNPFLCQMMVMTSCKHAYMFAWDPHHENDVSHMYLARATFLVNQWQLVTGCIINYTPRNSDC